MAFLTQVSLMHRFTGFLIVGMGLAGYGTVLCFVTSPEIRERADKTPRMTCDQLGQLLPADNTYIVLTDFRVCAGGFVFERDWETGAIDEVIVPVYPSRLPQEPDPRDLAILLRIRDEREKDRLFAQGDTREMACNVERGAQMIEPWMRKELEAKYPGIVLRDCWTVSTGLHEPTAARADSVMHTGIGLIVCGLVSLGIYHFARGSGAATTTQEMTASY